MFLLKDMDQLNAMLITVTHLPKQDRAKLLSWHDSTVKSEAREFHEFSMLKY